MKQINSLIKLEKPSLELMNKIKDLKQSVGKWIEADNEVTKKKFARFLT